MRFLCAKGTRTSKGKAGVGEEEEGGEAEVVAAKAARLPRTKCHNWRRILCEEKGMDQLISLAHLFVDYITDTISIEEAVQSWCSFEHPPTIPITIGLKICDLSCVLESQQSSISNEYPISSQNLFGLLLRIDVFTPYII